MPCVLAAGASSVPRELDAMVEMACALGAVGARMTGGGFGGCALCLVKNDDVPRFRTELAQRYETAIGVRPER